MVLDEMSPEANALIIEYKKALDSKDDGELAAVLAASFRADQFDPEILAIQSQCLRRLGRREEATEAISRMRALFDQKALERIMAFDVPLQPWSEDAEALQLLTLILELYCRLIERRRSVPTYLPGLKSLFREAPRLKGAEEAITRSPIPLESIYVAAKAAGYFDSREDAFTLLLFLRLVHNHVSTGAVVAAEVRHLAEFIFSRTDGQGWSTGGA